MKTAFKSLHHRYCQSFKRRRDNWPNVIPLNDNQSRTCGAWHSKGSFPADKKNTLMKEAFNSFVRSSLEILTFGWMSQHPPNAWKEVALLKFPPLVKSINKSTNFLRFF
jgi:hypothetical protein